MRCQRIDVFNNGTEKERNSMSKEKKEQVLVWTPPGILSFPYLSAPDTGREFSDNQYKTDLFIKKAEFEKHGQVLKNAVLSVGNEMFSGFSLDSGKFLTPFKDSDDNEKIVQDVLKGSIVVRAKAYFDKQKNPIRPKVYGPRKDSAGQWVPLTDDEIKNIKGGDYARLFVSVFAYDKSKTIRGVALALRAVQFWKSGTALGGAASKITETMEELEVPDMDTEAEAVI